MLFFCSFNNLDTIVVSFQDYNICLFFSRFGRIESKYSNLSPL